MGLICLIYMIQAFSSAVLPGPPGMSICPEKQVHWAVTETGAREHKANTCPTGRADETATHPDR
jgi:hypothetical protein